MPQEMSKDKEALDRQRRHIGMLTDGILKLQGDLERVPGMIAAENYKIEKQQQHIATLTDGIHKLKDELYKRDDQDQKIQGQRRTILLMNDGILKLQKDLEEMPGKFEYDKYTVEK